MLSRILRNNDFIRILAICQICILIFTVPIFAQPDMQDIDGMVTRVNNFTIWSDFTTNVSAYYGDDNATYLDTVTTASYNKLQKLYDAFRSQFYTSGIYAWTYNITNHQMNGVNNSPAAKVLEAIGYNTAYLSSMAYSINSSTSGIYNQVYSNLAKSSDISALASPLNQINTTLGGSSSGNIVNIKNSLSNIESIPLNSVSVLSWGFSSSLNNALNETYLSTGGTNNDVYLRINFTNELDKNSYYAIRFPMIKASNSSYYYIDDMYMLNNELNQLILFDDTDYDIEPYDFDSYFVITTDMFGRTRQSGGNAAAGKTIVFHITSNNGPYVLSTTQNLQVWSLSKNSLYRYILDANQYLKEIANKDSNIDVTINDSINSTDIELDVQIGINDFTEVNTISNKLRTWLSTGVGVSALIGALDQLDDSFFTLHNRSVIETINNQYTDFYD